MHSRGALFGISLVPEAANHANLVRQARLADAARLDLIGIQDHPYQRRFLDTFALIADLLARTERITIFPDVASLPLRGATMIAKAAASLDVMSGGRFELGLGAGTFWDAVAGMGGPRRSTSEAADALEEAIPLIRGALDVGPERRVVRGEGRFYPVPGYPPGPPPAHRVEIWIGAYRPRGLRMIGRMADGWVPSHGYMGPDAFRRASAQIDAAAEAAGRDPGAIRRLYNIGGAITTDGPDGPDLDGPVSSWIDRLVRWRTDPGVDAFIYWPPDDDSLDRYLGEVVPAVRSALGA
ncbi:MAG TPA: LLM class flavin-dependent oxidoreductase [Candidatus Limnocylindria bacterium]|nr:LLM class flavin-dependent oxidoreductase [Candidatus Limnocylindria bacterium]